jgi:tetratricopeptide (TPR) repeat protein
MTHHPTGLSRLISELRRRRVFRVIAIYAAVAWLVTQITATVSPALHLPSWTLTLVVVLVLVGFPVVLVMAWAFDLTPEGVQRTPSRAAPPAATEAAASAPRARLALPVLVVALLAAGAWAALLRNDGAGVAAGSSDTVAVLPFRFSGDASHAYLGEAMVDLLAAKLTTVSGPRAVDQRTALMAWRRAGGSEAEDLPLERSLAVAQSLGARHLLLGEVVSTPPRLFLTASLLEVPGGRLIHRANVEGSADSLTAIVDRLAARFLLLQAGETAHRLDALTTTSLPALTSYLHAQAMYRNGRHEAAMDGYTHALELDSTFALAGMGAYMSSQWGVIRPGISERALRLAWAARDRLPERDRLHLVALSGPDYPEPSSSTRTLAALEQAVNAAPDRAELWYEYGDGLFHEGARLGLADWRARSRAAFLRAIDLGLATPEPVMHLVELLLLEGDTARARAVGEEYLARTEEGGTRHYVQWLLDPEGAASATANGEEIDGGRRWRLVLRGAQDTRHGLGRDTEQALARLRAMRPSPAERNVNLRTEIGYLMNRGRVAEAGTAMAALAAAQSPSSSVVDRWRILHALYWDGPADAAAEAAGRLAQRTPVGPDADPAAAGAELIERCVLELWRVSHGEHDRTAAVITTLEAAGPPLDMLDVHYVRVCAAMLRALLAADVDPARLHAAAGALERTFDAEVPYMSFDLIYNAAPLVLAAVKEAAGDIDGALAASRRRPFGAGMQDFFISTFLREEGRLAARAGDRDAAIRAYSHYLTLRSDPDPALGAAVASVRRELEALTAEGRR